MDYFARAAGVKPIVIHQMSREIGLRDLVVVARLLWRFLKLRPDIIHTHKAKAGAVGRLAAMIYKYATPSIVRLCPRRCRIVHTYHGHVFHGYYGRTASRIFIAIERALARMCTDRVIVLSGQQSREISGRFRVGRPEQFRVIPLGLDLDEVQGGGGRGLRNELGISDKEIAIGIVGRLCEVKNHMLFLDAAARVLREGCAARFVVVGDGHLRKQLEQEAMLLGISHAVQFTGFRQDAASLYVELDIVALTSVNEGTPLTLIEAMCSERPIVATEVGGVPDLMGARRHTIDGITIWDHGATVPSGDVAAVARALKFLAERPEVRSKMGKSGRAFVAERMSKKRLLRDIEQLYRELAGLDRRLALQS
jgi:glycosyltransferase involved in cell wall biosynthesis